jgi:DNA-binding NarL/FixJ family response regulator
MASPIRVRIVLLSTYPVICAGLRRLLEGHDGFEVVGESASTSDMVAFLTREQADVVVIDPDAQDVSLRAITAIAEVCGSRLLVFTAATDTAMYTNAIELGASGVVAKEQSAHLLLRAIEKVHAGEIWLDRDKTAHVLSRAVRRDQDPELVKIESLTNREREIVALVGEGLGNAPIAERLFISEATVRNHLTSILSKVALANRFELAVYAFRHQLVSGPDPGALGGLARPQLEATTRQFAAAAGGRAAGRRRP